MKHLLTLFPFSKQENQGTKVKVLRAIESLSAIVIYYSTQLLPDPKPNCLATI